MKYFRIFAIVFVSALIFLAADKVGAADVIRNGSFNSDLQDWAINPDLPSTWNPLVNGFVSLHPETSGFYGTIIFQNLNVTGIGDKTFNLSMNLIKASTSEGNTVATYVNYVDNSGTVHRVQVINPDNGTILQSPVPPNTPMPTPVNASYTFPSDARKLIRFEISKEDSGEFYADDISLTAEGITIGAIPAISNVSPSSGNYGTSVTITGANFGASGTVFIGGQPVSANSITSWSDTAITLTVQDPIPSGKIVVRSDFSESNSTATFEVTSPHFTIKLLQDRITAIKGQTVEVTLKIDFYNGFATAAGIDFFVAEQPGAATFMPVPTKSPGGVVLRLNTAGINAGTYRLTVQSLEDQSYARFAYLNLNVVTVSDIKFYEYDTSNPTQRNYITQKTLTTQGQFGEISYEVHTSDGAMGNMQSGITLTSLNPSVIGAYLRYWGYDLHAVTNGTTALRAAAPDGTTRDLQLTVAIPPETNQITEISMNPPTISNKGSDTDNITFQATANYSFIANGSSFYFDPAGYSNFKNTFSNADPTFSADGKTIFYNFHMIPPDDYYPGAEDNNDHYLGADLGTAIFSIEGAHVPLTTFNDPSYSGIRIAVKSMESSGFLGDMLKIKFYSQDNMTAPVFVKKVSSMNLSSGKSIDVGGIPPGTYKVLFEFGGFGPASIQPQWWPNATTSENAATVTFNAGEFVNDIFFFATPAPTIFFAGSVKDGLNYPDAAIEVATVETVDNASLYAITDATGDFFISGIPADVPFALKIYKNGFTTVYSGNYDLDEDVIAPLPFALFPNGVLTAWGVEPGKGMVLGHVAQSGNPLGFLSGIAITAVETANPAITYPVVYLQADDSFGGTETTSDGVYAILNVPDGKTLTLTALSPNWAFDRTGSVTVHGDAITEESFLGSSIALPGSVEETLEDAINALNAKDISGFMAYVSGEFLDYGEDYAEFEAELTEMINDPDFEPMTYSIIGTSVDGDMATIYISWGGHENDTLIFRQEGTEWKLYGNQLRFDAYARSGYQALSDAPEIYWVSLDVDDPDNVITSVDVTGPGLPPSGISLNHDSGNNRWGSWPSDPSQDDLTPRFGRTKPALPLIYSCTINYTDSVHEQEVQSLTVSRFVDDAYATNVSPASGQAVTGPLVFSWNGPTGYSYSVEIDDGHYNRIWNSEYDLTDTTLIYDGPTLLNGFYTYTVVFNDGDGNASFTRTPFSIGAMGDITGEGRVTTEDVIIGLQLLTDTAGAQSVPYPATADIDNDGKITVRDVLAMLRIASGMQP